MMIEVTPTLGIPARRELPDQIISCNQGKAPVIFSRPPFSRDLYLYNKLVTQDAPFQIKVEPSQIFTVSPSFGVIPKGESVKITVKFRPNPTLITFKGEINGYLRLKTVDGFPLERYVFLFPSCVILYSFEY